MVGRVPIRAPEKPLHRPEIDAALATQHTHVAAARDALANAVATRTIDPALALSTVYRQILCQNELLRSASGVLAERHYSPVSAQ